jgi:hypothetical protein
LWSVAWLGSTPIGGPIVGWVGQTLGARWSLVIGGLAAVGAGVLGYRSLVAIDRKAAQQRAVESVTARVAPLAEPAATELTP